MENDSLESLVEVSLSVLVQLENMLMQMNEGDYKRPLEILNQSTISQHTRHIIEFYHCLLNGASKGEVCYSNRKRNKSLEQSVTYTLTTIGELKQALSFVKFASLQIRDGNYMIPSNTARELLYCMEHAVHHMAIIKIALNAFLPSLNLPASFGVAASTIRHQNSCAH